MPNDKRRVLLIASHPVQYQAPLFRLMAQNPRLDIQVAYCSLNGVEAALDRDFGVELAWDIPLLDGYPWVHIPHLSRRATLGQFLGLINPGLWKLISSRKYDAVVIYTGYAYLSFWIALLAAKLHRVPILFGTDAHELAARDGKRWKIAVKKFLWPLLFPLADVVIVPSSGGTGLMRAMGIPDERLVMTPYVVDNDWWTTRAEAVDRGAIRRGWCIPEDVPVVLFCAKLQPWKRPLDVLVAFSQSGNSCAHLVYAGEGTLRAELESRADSLGLAGRVHFLGFTNQSLLPSVYRAADLLVLPSEYEPFGVVVNEAMLCGCAVAVSDRVGAARDLITNGQNGYVFPCGNVSALAQVLREIFGDQPNMRRLGERARLRMDSWSPAQNIQALVQAVDQSLAMAASR